jgi:DNA-binding response OmpR family regulator
VPSGVTILWWPDEMARLLRLRADHVARLVVVQGELLPPPPPDWNEEEWLKSPFTPELLDHSLTMLQLRLEQQPPPPEIGLDDVLWFGDHSAVLAAREARLARLFVNAFGHAVPYAALYASIDLSVLDEHALRPLIARLRRRIRPMGLEIQLLRGIGYAMRSRSPQPTQ